MTKSAHFSIPVPKAVKDHGAKRFVPPVIPFERPEEAKKTKDKYLTFKLRSVPTEEASTTYDLSIPFFGVKIRKKCLFF